MGISRRKLRRGWMRHLGAKHIFHKGLWMLERDSVAKACLIGFWVATSPFIGLHVFLAIGLCLWFRANMPVAFALQWVTNIFTAPIFYPAAYLLGCVMLRKPHRSHAEIQVFCENIWNHLLFRPVQDHLGPPLAVFQDILWPLFLGCNLIGLAAGALSAVLVLLFWRSKTADENKPSGLNHS